MSAIIKRGLPPAEYHTSPQLSASGMQHLRRSPAHYAWAMEHPEPTTDSMTVGTIAHALVFDGYTTPLECGYALKPTGMSFATKEGKAWRDEAFAAGFGKDEIIDLEQWSTAVGICAAVRSLPVWAEIEKARKAGNCEVTIIDGDLRGRIDCVPPRDGPFGKAILDLKTCISATPSAFARDTAKLGRAIQANHYLDLWNRANPDEPREFFAFICVENSPPFAAAIYVLGPRSMDAGRIERDRLLALYRQCVAVSEWPGFDSSPQIVEMPGWALSEAV